MVSPYGQRDAGPKHVAARKLAHFVQKAYSAFANGTDEITFLPHTKKATVQTRKGSALPVKRRQREEREREREKRVQRGKP